MARPTTRAGGASEGLTSSSGAARRQASATAWLSPRMGPYPSRRGLPAETCQATRGRHQGVPRATRQRSRGSSSGRDRCPRRDRHQGGHRVAGVPDHEGGAPHRTPERLGQGRADVPPGLHPSSRAEGARDAAAGRGSRACPHYRGALATVAGVLTRTPVDVARNCRAVHDADEPVPFSGAYAA